MTKPDFTIRVQPGGPEDPPMASVAFQRIAYGRYLFVDLHRGSGAPVAGVVEDFSEAKDWVRLVASMVDDYERVDD